MSVSDDGKQFVLKDDELQKPRAMSTAKALLQIVRSNSSKSFDESVDSRKNNNDKKPNTFVITRKSRKAESVDGDSSVGASASKRNDKGKNNEKWADEGEISVDTRRRENKKKCTGGNDSSVGTAWSMRKKRKNKKSHRDGESSIDTRSSSKKKKNKKRSKGDGANFVDTSRSRKNKSKGDEDTSVITRKSRKNKVVLDVEENEPDENPFSRRKEIRHLVKYALRKTDSLDIVENLGGRSVLNELDLAAIVGEALQYHHEIHLFQDSFYDELPHTFLQSIVCVFVSHATRSMRSKSPQGNKVSHGMEKIPTLMHEERDARDATNSSLEEDDYPESVGSQKPHQELTQQRLEEELQIVFELMRNKNRSKSSMKRELDYESDCSSIISIHSDYSEEEFFSAVSDLYCGVLDSWDGGCGWTKVVGDDVETTRILMKPAMVTSIVREGLACVAINEDSPADVVLDKEDDAGRNFSIECQLGSSPSSGVKDTLKVNTVVTEHISPPSASDSATPSAASQIDDPLISKSNEELPRSEYSTKLDWNPYPTKQEETVNKNSQTAGHPSEASAADVQENAKEDTVKELLLKADCDESSEQAVSSPDAAWDPFASASVGGSVHDLSWDARVAMENSAVHAEKGDSNAVLRVSVVGDGSVVDSSFELLLDVHGTNEDTALVSITSEAPENLEFDMDASGVFNPFTSSFSTPDAKKFIPLVHEGPQLSKDESSVGSDENEVPIRPRENGSPDSVMMLQASHYLASHR